jgi:hypothetical protein
MFFNDTGGNDNTYGGIFFHTDGSFGFNGYSTQFRRTAALYRDLSAWMHCVVVCNSISSTAQHRMRIYVNGAEITDWTANSTISQNYEFSINIANEHRIGRVTGAYLNGYLADVHFIDGQALAATDFGETDDNGVWQAKEFTRPTIGGTVQFANNTSSTVFDSSNTSLTLNVTGYSYSDWAGSGVASGLGGANKVKVLKSANGNPALWAVTSSSSTTPYIWLSQDGINWTSPGSKYSTSSTTLYLTAPYIGWAGGTESITWTIGSGAEGPNSFHLPFTDNSSNAALGTDTSGNSNTWTVNNLTAAAAGLATANQGMDVVTYSGNGGTQSISSLAFQPDFIWCKTRSNAVDHKLADSVRGFTKILESNQTRAEVTDTNAITAVGSTGFTLGSGGDYNSNGRTYVAWCWKAGGAAVSNTDGSINSSVSVNAAYGFSITKYVGTGSLATVGHGLGSSAPKFMLIKGLDDPLSWAVYANSPSNYLQLNDSGASSSPDASNAWNGTAPTSSVFTVKTKATVNESGENYIAYCWSEVAGFSKFSTYTGTGSANKVVTGLGFKPRYLLIKRTNGSIENWQVADSERGTDAQLHPDLSQAETTTASRNISFQDDGFTIIGTNAGINGSGDNYIYAAFAAKPDGSVIDSLRDSPTQIAAPTDTGAGGEVVGNYATLNPLESALTGLNNGNLNSGASGAASWKIVTSTIAVSSGKYYWEGFTDTTANASAGWQWGVCNVSPASLTTPYGTSKWSYQGAYIYNQTASQTAVGTTAGANDLLGYALDMDAGTLKLYVNNSLVHTFTGLTGTVTPFVGSYGAPTMTVNFGQRAFAYTAPSGYKSLNTANLPTPTIADGSKYFDTKLYTGNQSVRSISTSFSPSLVWIKDRTQNGHNHNLLDIVRGAPKILQSDTTAAEITDSTDGFTSFNSDGFSLGANVLGNQSYELNKTGNAYAAWAWDGGSSNTTIAAGSLNSSVYNQSQTWSNNITTTGNSGTWLNKTHMFDANLTNYAHANGDGSGSATVTLTFSPAVTCTSNITFIGGITSGNPGSISINGGTAVALTACATANPAATDTTIVPFSGSISSIVVTKTTSTAAGLLIYGWKVDNKTLIDYGVTPTNVPSIASTVRANPSAGFSIVSYTGVTGNQNFGHGLNVKPKFILIKNRSNSADWFAMFDTGATHYQHGYLNGTSQFHSATDQSVTSSTITLGNNNSMFGANGNNYVAFCFAPVNSYSAMGSYVGNGSADGVFIYTGFTPSWLLFKRHDAGSDWTIYDTKRDPHNVAGDKLEPNTSDAESAEGAVVDILSNGFKFRRGSLENGGNDAYIYLAFASHPLKTARAR